jgi:glutamate-ammonia-ligase adenylyltransferase
VSVYYGRLAQRFIAALTAQTAEGGLYEVDMRLRPSGNKGPVAVSLESFSRYHAADAWTWERMALTRARVICAPAALREKIGQVVRSTLCARGEAAKLKIDAREMRERLAAQFSARDNWDLKFAAGGLVDIEFIAQYLQLREAAVDLFDVNTLAALGKLKSAGALAGPAADALIDAASVQQALMQVLRIAMEGRFDRPQASHGLEALLVRAAGERDFESLERRLASLQFAARAIYERVLC